MPADRTIAASPPPRRPPSPSPAAPPPRPTSRLGRGRRRHLPREHRARLRRRPTIDAAPERVATWGWGSTEAALARGRRARGDGPADLRRRTRTACCPWVADELDELGAETPIDPHRRRRGAAVRGDRRGRARRDPRAVLGHHRGAVRAPQRDRTRRRLPRRAVDDPVARRHHRRHRARQGRRGADGVLDDLDAELAEQAEAHPELEGKTVAAVWDVAGTFYVYTPEDSARRVPLGLGLENAPAVDELANGDSPFYYTLSYEQLDKLDSDIDPELPRHAGGGGRVPQPRRRSRPSRRSPAARSPRSSAPSSSRPSRRPPRCR